jgi:hypothetical protein
MQPRQGHRRRVVRPHSRWPGRAAEPLAEQRSPAEWPGQGWTESIAERRVSALDAVRSRADALATGRRVGGELTSNGTELLPSVDPVQPGRGAVGVRAGAPAPERGGPCREPGGRH